MKQIYHPYTKWECYKNGMWRTISLNEKSKILFDVIAFTGNHVAYGKAMDLVIQKWVYTCENHLTDMSLNRKAWLGHAACNLKFGWCESVVREAWGRLTQEQQDLANAEAERAIKVWEFNQSVKTIKNYGQLQIEFNES